MLMMFYWDFKSMWHLGKFSFIFLIAFDVENLLIFPIVFKGFCYSTISRKKKKSFEICPENVLKY